CIVILIYRECCRCQSASGPLIDPSQGAASSAQLHCGIQRGADICSWAIDFQCMIYLAKPQISVSADPENGTSGIQTLTCVAAGFFPRDLNVSWMVAGDVPHETESASLTVNSDGTFTMSSRLSLQIPDWHLGSAVTCQIQHITLIPPGTERISFPPGKSFRFTLKGLHSTVLHSVPNCYDYEGS
uniref:Ig-like domain-containing protein n=1 Tax=Callorhinchus milii TaxID=7868 RepID=A0A4W3GFG8_CALMI